jgi:hypothetical protein
MPEISYEIEQDAHESNPVRLTDMGIENELDEK